MNFRVPLKSDLNKVRKILKHSGLPYEDCIDHLDNFLLVEKQEAIVGVGGFELYGEVALIRSLVVLEKHRGKNTGKLIYNKIKASALSHGVKELYLLTETAEQFFKARKFCIVKRELVPKSIKQTNQFSYLCPSSAIVRRHVFS